MELQRLDRAVHRCPVDYYTSRAQQGSGESQKTAPFSVVRPQGEALVDIQPVAATAGGENPAAAPARPLFPKGASSGTQHASQL